MELIISAVVAVLLGVLSGKTWLAQTALALIPWALAALGIGAFSRTARSVRWNGAVFGFLLLVVFAVSSYSGLEPPRRIYYLFALGLGVAGALAGMGTSWLGHWARRHLR